MSKVYDKSWGSEEHYAEKAKLIQNDHPPPFAAVAVHFDIDIYLTAGLHTVSKFFSGPGFCHTMDTAEVIHWGVEWDRALIAQGNQCSRAMGCLVIVTLSWKKTKESHNGPRRGGLRIEELNLVHLQREAGCAETSGRRRFFLCFLPWKTYFAERRGQGKIRRLWWWLRRLHQSLLSSLWEQKTKLYLFLFSASAGPHKPHLSGN